MFGRLSMPLTVFATPPGATIAEAGLIYDAQAAIGALFAVRWEPTLLRRDSARCHRAGGQSLDQRRDRVSRTGRARLVHSPAQALAREVPLWGVSSGPAQTPWSVPAPAGGDAPAQAAGWETHWL